MARFYGRDSRYLLERDYGYFFWALAVILLPVVVGYIAYVFASPLAAIVIAVALLFFVVKWIQPLNYFFKRKSDMFYKGRYGEKDIKKELRELPDDYAVFEGVMLDKNHGDIDFVLVGPKGIVSLEVKSLGGGIGYDGHSLTVNGRKLRGRDFLAQAFGEARAISMYVRGNLGVDVYTKPVLVFSSPFAVVHFGDLPVDNVYVASKETIFSVLHSFSDYQWQREEQHKVEALLKVTVGR